MGVIELSPQPGDRELAHSLGNRGIRVHSINPQELLGIDPQVAVERWRRAVRERNVRMLYVRPLPTENPYVQPADNERISPEVMLFQKNVDYVWRIAEAVRLDGFYIGDACTFRPWSIRGCFCVLGGRYSPWRMATFEPSGPRRATSRSMVGFCNAILPSAIFWGTERCCKRYSPGWRP